MRTSVSGLVALAVLDGLGSAALVRVDQRLGAAALVGWATAPLAILVLVRPTRAGADRAQRAITLVLIGAAITVCGSLGRGTAAGVVTAFAGLALGGTYAELIRRRTTG